MQRYMWTLIILLHLSLCVGAANNPPANWFDTIFSDVKKAVFLVGCVSAGVTAVVVSLLCQIRISYIRRRALEEDFGVHEEGPGDNPPPVQPNPFNPPPPPQPNPSNNPPEEPNPFNPSLEEPNPFISPSEQSNPFDPSPEQPNPFNSPPVHPNPFNPQQEQPNPLDSNAPSAANYPPRSNPIAIPSSAQPRIRHRFLHSDFDRTDSESSQEERSSPSTQGSSSSRSRGRPRRRGTRLRVRSLSESDVSRNRRGASNSRRVVSSSSDSAIDEYLYMNPRGRRPDQSRRQQENTTRALGGRRDESESLFSTDERREFMNRVRAATQHRNRVRSRRDTLQHTSGVHSYQANLQQELIAGPSFTSPDNTGIVASGSTSEHPAALMQSPLPQAHSQEHITGPSVCDETRFAFAIDETRLLTTRVRAILQHANRVHSHRAILQHTDRVQSQQAIVEQAPTAGPSITTPDNTGNVASGSASELPADPAQSSSPREHSETSSSSDHSSEEVDAPVNNSPPPYWRFTEHFDN